MAAAAVDNYPYIQSGELIPELTHYQQQTIPLYAVYKESHTLPFRLSALIDFISEALTEPTNQVGL